MKPQSKSTVQTSHKKLTSITSQKSIKNPKESFIYFFQYHAFHEKSLKSSLWTFSVSFIQLMCVEAHKVHFSGKNVNSRWRSWQRVEK
jgi:hypothetical protein